MEPDNSQDSIFALTESASRRKKLKFQTGEKQHRSHTRHTTGITQQEHVKRDQRFQADDLYITGAEALKEHVLDEILSHRIDTTNRQKRYRYLVSCGKTNLLFLLKLAISRLSLRIYYGMIVVFSFHKRKDPSIFANQQIVVIINLY
jgi:hypothetical protein